MVNYVTMMLDGATMYQNRDGKYHVMYNGVKHPMTLSDANRVRRHGAIKKSRSNVWVRRKPRFRAGAQCHA